MEGTILTENEVLNMDTLLNTLKFDSYAVLMWEHVMYCLGLSLYSLNEKLTQTG